MPQPTPSVPVADESTSRIPGVLAVVVVVVSVLLGVASVAAPWLLSVALAACAVIIAWGWSGTFGLPSPRGTVGVLLVGGLALVLAVAVREEEPWLGWAPAALALAMIAAFVHQLLRRDGRPRVVQSVSSVVLGLALVGCGILMVPASHSAEGIALLLGALAAACASAVTDVLGRWSVLQGWLVALAMVGGGLASTLVAIALDATPTTWLVVGVGAGALSHAMRSVLVGLPQLAHARPRLVAGVVSVLVVGVVPYAVGLAFVPTAFPG
ncbi:hypothetical protein [Serinicoccus kebangsaanensis]|uniref:hypothetical protein n=1 Tax=Serinicoccus kebangsaanensis TaxID=2602069 RepID=UPI00124DD2AF|nr:hypothetical protein [Serinicoccus kebangsaanensis]